MSKDEDQMIEVTLEKALMEIRRNHAKILEDWCKAYCAQLYSENGRMNPGDFILVEQMPTFDEVKGCIVQKYWFELKQNP